MYTVMATCQHYSVYTVYILCVRKKYPLSLTTHRKLPTDCHNPGGEDSVVCTFTHHQVGVARFPVWEGNFLLNRIQYC